MKLKTKLLPFLGIGAVASVITPLMVSCNQAPKNTYEIYIPTIDKAIPVGGGTYASENATLMYGTHLLANPEIFIQDEKCYSSYMSQRLFNLYLEWCALESIQPLTPTIDINVEISNLSIDYPIESQSIYGFPTLTFDLKGKIDCDAKEYYFYANNILENEDQSSDIKIKHYIKKMYVENFNMHFENLPIWLVWNTASSETGDAHWSITSPALIGETVLTELEPWSITCNVGNASYSDESIYTSFTRKPQSYKLNEKAPLSSLEEQDRKILAIILSSSVYMQFVYHMSDIPGKI